MLAKFQTLPIRERLLIAVMCLWVFVAFLDGVAYSVLRWGLHSEYEIVPMIAMILIMTPLFILINKEGNTWKALIVKFAKVFVLFASGMALFIAGIHISIYSYMQLGDTRAGIFSHYLILLTSLFWTIYLCVRAWQLLMPKKEVQTCATNQNRT